MIMLPKCGWRNELMRERLLSVPARNLLDEILVHEENHTPGVIVTKEALLIATKELSQGINMGGRLFVIKVFVPTLSEHISSRTVFVLQQKHLGGEIKDLSEIQIEE